MWPAHGFNCLRWKARGHELLYAAPDWKTNPVPTRSGVPLLFPFPNRIRGGQFRHEGREFTLPKNDSAKANAIHGFAPRRAWTVGGYGTEPDGAWLHGDFRISVNAPEANDLWPGDALLSVVYRFAGPTVRISFRVANMGAGTFPFGLGLHPYFKIPGADRMDDTELLAPARSIWPLADSLPAGPKQPVPDALNFNSPRLVAGTTLDTVYGDLGVLRARPDGLLLRAVLKRPDAAGQLDVWTTADFRESVLFTPVHRQALCIEPYTCVTDAANLGADTGWHVLPPGGVWAGAVEFAWTAG